jgi:SAM-dependent methyltransferase
MLLMPCPACTSTHIKVHSPYRFGQSCNSYLPKDYQILICKSCGLWFKDNIPSEVMLKMYYANLTTETDGWNYPERLPHEKLIDVILSSLPISSKVLDVGCWTGRLLREHGNRLKIYGIEPNISAASIAQENGLLILGTEVTEQLSLEHSFKCITMVDVFEHLPNPIPILDHLLAALEPGGKLFIITGTTNCLPIQLSGASYWYFAIPDHLVFLNRKFASWLQNRSPKTKVTYTPMRHFPFIWNRRFFELAWLLCWRFLSPHSPFSKPPLYRLTGFKRFERLQDPIMCTTWKDHAVVKIEKLF